ncbi:hypothetical protein [Micromonospora sp. SL4-19]|uniref:hypothetical protein n=1 Tax=Micromonospora sp. SL4-19 TaxID=3399129 RepID=UPI003A4DAE78
MMAFLVVLAVAAVLLAALFGYVGWRDRHRLSSDDDRAVVRAARSESYRRAAERDHAQSDGWNRGGHGLPAEPVPPTGHPGLREPVGRLWAGLMP